jgi:hypothetical protein
MIRFHRYPTSRIERGMDHRLGNVTSLRFSGLLDADATFPHFVKYIGKH